MPPSCLCGHHAYIWYKIYMGTRHPYTLKKKDKLIILHVTIQEIELYIHSFYQGLSNRQRLQGIAELKIREWKIPLSIPLNASLLLALWLFNNLMSLSTLFSFMLWIIQIDSILFNLELSLSQHSSSFFPLLGRGVYYVWFCLMRERLQHKYWKIKNL